MLCRETIVDRRRLVCRLRAYPGCGCGSGAPSIWRSGSRTSRWRGGGWMSRRFAIPEAIRLFCDHLLDRRYPGTAICSQRLGVCPRQIVDEHNLMVHTDEVDAEPAGERSRTSTSKVLDQCDAQVAGRRRGSLAALRDAAPFNTIYARGCAARDRQVRCRGLLAQSAQARLRALWVIERVLRQGDGRRAAAAETTC
jgi:hypothetical protein